MWFLIISSGEFLFDSREVSLCFKFTNIIDWHIINNFLCVFNSQGQLSYEIQTGDRIMFISTLHGGWENIRLVKFVLFYKFVDSLYTFVFLNFSNKLKCWNEASCSKLRTTVVRTFISRQCRIFGYIVNYLNILSLSN